MRDGPGKTALKRKALTVLQRRKQLEAQKDQYQQQSWNMEQASMLQDNLKSGLLSALVIAGCLVGLAPKRWIDSVDGVSGGAARRWGVVVAVVVPSGIGMLCLGKRLINRFLRADVAVTVDALKTTNKELKKQYGKINIDQSAYKSDTFMEDVLTVS